MIRRLESNIIKLYCLGFLSGFQILMPIFVPMLQRHGLSMTEVLQTQVVFAMTVVLCELPSGYFADLFGRKNVLLIGYILCVLGFLGLVQSDTFFEYCLAEIVLGFAMSFISGADTALLYDTLLMKSRVLAKQKIHLAYADGKAVEISEDDPEQRRKFAVHIGNLMSFGMLAAALASLLSGVLVQFSFETVIACQILVSAFAVFIAINLFEPGIKRMSKVSHLDNASAIVKHVLFGDRLLRLIFMGLIAYGIANFYAMWLIQKYWELAEVPLAQFGLLWALFNLAGSLSAKFAYSLEKRAGPVPVLIACAAMPALGYLAMASSYGAFAIAFGATFFISRGVALVLLKEGLNRRVPSEFRATVMSFNSLSFRMAFIVTMPLIGFLIDGFGLRLAFYILAFAVALFLGLLISLIAQELQNPRQSQSAKGSKKIA